MDGYKLNGIIMFIGSIIGSWAMFKIESIYDFVAETYSPWWFMRFGMVGFFVFSLFLVFGAGSLGISNTE